MSNFSIATRDFTGKRIQVDINRPFEEVLKPLHALVGRAAIDKWSAASPEEFIEEIKATVGESDFMLFQQIDHGAWLSKFKIKTKLVRRIFGNPLIARTMLEHDHRAGLFVPVELLLLEQEPDLTCSIIYVLPPSLIATATNPALLSSAQVLDAKVEALVRRVAV